VLWTKRGATLARPQVTLEVASERSARSRRDLLQIEGLQERHLPLGQIPLPYFVQHLISGEGLIAQKIHKQRRLLRELSVGIGHLNQRGLGRHAARFFNIISNSCPRYEGRIVSLKKRISLSDKLRVEVGEALANRRHLLSSLKLRHRRQSRLQ
jgi:hypothetical protein